MEAEKTAANAELASIVVRLKNLRADNKDLSAAIASLELAIQALGKVKTTFEQTRQYRLGVKTHSEKLTDHEIFKLYAETELQDEFINDLKSSGLRWLALFEINNIVNESIRKVDDATDNIMNNLPTKMQAFEIIKSEADVILYSLKNEDSVVKK